MAADLARQPHTNLMAQLCGDAHVQNMGSFETPDGRIVFDINDFDETTAGPWEWDVKRMAASIVLAGLESAHNLSSSADAVEAFATVYLQTIRQMASQPVLVSARHQIHRLKKVQAVSAALRQAERAQPADLLNKYTEPDRSGTPRFRHVEDVLWRVGGPRRSEVLRSLLLYRESLAPDRVHLFSFFRPLDVAFKIVGTGSVALRDYVVLMEGNGTADPLFLQIKQEVDSAYARYLPVVPSRHQGRRVAEGQRKIQPTSDLMLGWTRIGQRDFLVRQLNDHKGRIDLESLRENGLSTLSAIAGELLARGHARSGDALAIASYAGSGGKIVEGLVNFGKRYAELTEQDYQLFKAAIAKGRFKVAS